MISITSSDTSLRSKAQSLAAQWGFKFSKTPPQEAFFLQVTPARLQLIQSDRHSPGPIYIDFSSGSIAHRRLFGGGKGQTIAKAVGLNKHPSPLILDATAGMGKDAFIFASLGAEVILMERSPISAVLLTDALHRAALDESISEIIQRMSFIFSDARNLDSQKLIREPDVIYLDPMFPHRKKSALVKKEMLAFQNLIGDDNDSNELLSTCLKRARKRVVVKRPIKASYLNEQKPTYSLNMKKHRFDIYIK